MKLVKLSLATIVAAGALSSVVSAASLEEAIKNVDVSGYARYRYDARNTNTSDSEFNGNTHRFTTDIDFKSAVGDNFFGVIGFRYDSSDVSGERAGADTQVGQALNVRQFYLGYTAGNTTIQAGRQVLGTFFTDDMVGTGIKFLNKDIVGLTLVGIAFDNLQADGDIGTGELNIGPNGSTEKVYDRNLYGVASIGSYDPVSFQAWYAALDSVAQLYALDVTLGANLGGADLSLQAQYAGSAMWAKNARTQGETKQQVDLNNVNNSGVTDVFSNYVPGDVGRLEDGQFWAIKAGAEAFGFDASVGY
ncbi:major outer membrane protein, partial [Campylobacter lanienae]|uniref:major outer membrane protein n=1 Tax=Campylobacter lanienae TaxID=75658 RepID=UPI002A91BABD